jgi:hypothetical protein
VAVELALAELLLAKLELLTLVVVVELGGLIPMLLLVLVVQV